MSFRQHLRTLTDVQKLHWAAGRLDTYTLAELQDEVEALHALHFLPEWSEANVRRLHRQLVAAGDVVKVAGGRFKVYEAPRRAVTVEEAQADARARRLVETGQDQLF